ncbi:hypothetical protein EV126DRAFT_408768 [Verticillium dahliae]|nr:hypothetical protein EV126DRAFT_408768 [Verticillium dahliae]
MCWDARCWTASSGVRRHWSACSCPVWEHRNDSPRMSRVSKVGLVCCAWSVLQVPCLLQL